VSAFSKNRTLLTIDADHYAGSVGTRMKLYRTAGDVHELDPSDRIIWIKLEIEWTSHDGIPYHDPIPPITVTKASMTSFLYKHRKRSSRTAAFTLIEVMVSGTLGLILVAGVITTFLMIGRSSVRIINYSMMEKETRVAFEQLGIDARMASDITSKWTGNLITGFILTIPSTDGAKKYEVTYYYENSTLFVVRGTSPEPIVTTALVTNISSLTFNRFDASGALIPTSNASDSGVKHIQASVSTVRSGMGVVAATQVIRSTAFTIRNKTSS
jgi:hypothetical protein